MEVGDKLNPQRSYRKGFALKGLHQHVIKTNNPSTIGPDELLTMRFPNLKENQVIIPSTTKLTFNISLAGTDVNRTLVGNLGRNIIRKLIVKLENEFLDNMIRSGHRRLARSFNPCYRYIDDLIVFNNKKFLDYLKEIYPSQLTVEKANKSDHLADYLDLTFIIDSGGKLSTRLYDKHDDFDFHIVNFPFLSSNIPSGPSYGVYISQLIRYARCCSHYDDFRYHHKCLVDRLLSQGYKALRLEKSFKKFYGRYQDLIEKYQRSVNAMVSDSFPGQFLFNM